MLQQPSIWGQPPTTKFASFRWNQSSFHRSAVRKRIQLIVPGVFEITGLCVTSLPGVSPTITLAGLKLGCGIGMSIEVEQLVPMDRRCSMLCGACTTTPLASNRRQDCELSDLADLRIFHNASRRSNIQCSMMRRLFFQATLGIDACGMAFVDFELATPNLTCEDLQADIHHSELPTFEQLLWN